LVKIFLVFLSYGMIIEWYIAVTCVHADSEIFVCVQVSSTKLWKWPSDICRLFLLIYSIEWSLVSCYPLQKCLHWCY